MAFQYQFSVGQMQVGNNLFGICTEISVSYDGNPQSFYGGDYRLPLAVELGNRTGEITCGSARFSTDDLILDNRYLNVILSVGQNSGGLTGTINNCKVTKYDVKSTQDAFVVSNIHLLITSPAAAQATKGGVWPVWA